MIPTSNKLRDYVTVTLLIGVFIITVTVVFLIIQGKRFTPGGGFVQTGVIKLETIPDNVNIYINGRSVSRSDRLIQNIPLGLVTLTLNREGYSEWEKEIVIEPGVVKEVFAHLYPDELNIQQIVTLNIDKVVYSKNIDHVFFTVKDAENPLDRGLWKLRLSSGFLGFGQRTEPEQIAMFTSVDVEDLLNNYELQISDDSKRLLLSSNSRDVINIYNVDRRNEFINLTDQIGFIPDKVEWFDGSKSVLVESNNLVYEYNLDNKQKVIVTYNPSYNPIYCRTHNAAYFVNPEDNQLHRYANSRSDVVVIKERVNFRNATAVYCSGENQLMVAYEEQEGLIYINLERNYVERFSTANSTVTDVSPEGDTILFSNLDKLFSFIIRPSAVETGIVTERKPLGDVNSTTKYFFAGSNHKLIKVDTLNPTAGLQIGDVDGTNFFTIFSQEDYNPESVIISKDNKKLYVLLLSNQLTSKNYNLYRIDLDRN